MAVWPQNSIRSVAPPAPAAAADDRRPANGGRGHGPAVAGESTRTPAQTRPAIGLDSLIRTPAADPRFPIPALGNPGNSVLPLFRTDSCPFVNEIRSSGYLQTVSGLLHSRSAFGIGLPLTASDRRHLGCGCSSVVEHDLAKVGVEGSSPFARSRFSQLAKRWIQPTGRPWAALSFVRLRQAGADAAEGITASGRSPRDAIDPDPGLARVNVVKQAGEDSADRLVQIDE